MSDQTRILEQVSRQINALVTPGLTKDDVARAFALLADALEARDEMRAILTPLLDDPFEGDTGVIHCRFCDRSLGGGDDLAYSPRDDARFVHADDCPVLDRDRLLGRTPPRQVDAGVANALERLD